MPTVTYAEALVDAVHAAMKEDPRINLLGSYLLGLGPTRTLMDRLRQDFADRIVDPPCSEAAVVSLGIGAAMVGDRPIVDIGTASFLFEAWSQIVNEAGNAHAMTGGQVTVPVVFHMLHGLRGGSAAQHGHSPQAMLWNAPGIEIVLPASPRDAKGLMRSALKSPNPTVFIDHAKLLGQEGDVPDDDLEIPFGVAEVKREGNDITIVATSLMVSLALQAAEQLARDGVSAEVVDPRTLVPFDRDTIVQSVEKTGRLLVVDEANLSCSVASEIAAIAAEEAFGALKAPVRRLCRPDVPVPFSPPLEDAVAINVEKIAVATAELAKMD